MKFYEFVVNELVNRGLFKNQATEIVNREIEVNELMRGRWEDNINDYPSMARHLVMFSLNETALKYIKENCPEAWFRPIFDMEHPLRKEYESLQNR